MKKTLFLFALLLSLGLVLFLLKQSGYQSTSEINMDNNAINITSPSFQDGDKIPVKFSCDGENINPQLDISGVPEETLSLVLIVEDPDAPNGTFTHWIVFNINPDATLISENSTPDGATIGKNGFGLIGYGGPCPPSGVHHYLFRIYALDAKLDIPKGVDVSEVTKAMNNHVIASGQLMGLYSKE